MPAQQHERQQKEYAAEQERRAEQLRQEQQPREYEAEQAKREKQRKARQATFDRILATVPATFTAAQLRVLLAPSSTSTPTPSPTT